MSNDAIEFKESSSVLPLHNYPSLLELLKEQAKSEQAGVAPADSRPFIPSINAVPTAPFQLPNQESVQTGQNAEAAVPKPSVESEKDDLLSTFQLEFNDKAGRGLSIGDLSLARDNSKLADLLYRNFDQLHDLAMTRDGGILAYMDDPKHPTNTISYNDLKKMVRLTDRRIIGDYWTADEIEGQKKHMSRSYGWAGAISGAVVGGGARVFIPAMRGDGGALCLAMMLGGAAIGAWAGEQLGYKEGETYVRSKTEFDREAHRYGDWLGRGYAENTVIAGAGILTAGVLLGNVAPKWGAGLMAAGMGTIFIGAHIAKGIGYRSALKELEAERALGDRMLKEWEELKKK